MRIATFNLESLDDRPGAEPALPERIARLRPQLERLEADILCLQEVNAQPVSGRKRAPRRFAALESLLDGTPYAGFHRVATLRESGAGPLDVHNLVTLSRYPIVARRQIRHVLVAPPAFRMTTAEPAQDEAGPVEWDRPLLYAAVAAGDRRVHVINLHLRAPLAGFVPGQKLGPFAWRSVAGWSEGFFAAAVKRTGQALEARLFVETLFDAEPGALVAVAGDCNADDYEMPLRILRASPHDTGNPDLAGRSLMPVERAAPAERRFTVRHAGRASMLDHLLVSPTLLAALRAVEIHNEGLADEVFGDAAPEAAGDATTGAAAGSFHAPLVAAFDLPADADAPFTGH